MPLDINTIRAYKGGALSTSGNTIQLDGDWGLVLCWGGKPDVTPPPTGGGPDHPDLWLAAKALDKAPDLFPAFGMRALS